MIKYPSIKMYAILRDGIMVDGWVADSLEEAKADNPDAEVYEITLENSPWVLGEKR